LLLKLNTHIYIEVKEMKWGGEDWISLAEDRDTWRDVVNMVMNLRFSMKADGQVISQPTKMKRIPFLVSLQGLFA
jgi:hypothetical protein